MGRVSLLATRATELALEDAGLLGTTGSGDGRTGVATARPRAARPTLSIYARAFGGEDSAKGVTPSDYLQFMSHTCAANLAAFFGVRGPHHPDLRAPARRAARRIGYGYEAIRFGRAGRDALRRRRGAPRRSTSAVFDVLYAASTPQRRARAHAAPVRPRPRRAGGRRGRRLASCSRSSSTPARAARASTPRSWATAPTATARHLTNPDRPAWQQVMRLAPRRRRPRADADRLRERPRHRRPTLGDVAESEATRRRLRRQDAGELAQGPPRPHARRVRRARGLDHRSRCCARAGSRRRSTSRTSTRAARRSTTWWARRASTPARIAVSNNFAFGGVNTSLVLRPGDD